MGKAQNKVGKMREKNKEGGRGSKKKKNKEGDGLSGKKDGRR